MEQLAIVRARTDISGASLSQLIVRELLVSALFDRHVVVLREEHRHRYEAMVQALGRLLPARSVSWRPVDGGLYVWVHLDDPRLDAARLQMAAARAGVMVVAGQPFYADGGGERRLRLCFAGVPPAGIETGISRLVSTVRTIADAPAVDPPPTRPLV